MLTYGFEVKKQSGVPFKRSVKEKKAAFCPASTLCDGSISYHNQKFLWKPTAQIKQGIKEVEDN